MGTYTPTFKTFGGQKYDLANTAFRKLPAQIQYQNLISTKLLCQSVVKHRSKKNGAFTKSFVEQTAKKLHDAWRGRQFYFAAKHAAEKAATTATTAAAATTGDAKIASEAEHTQMPYKKL